MHGKGSNGEVFRRPLNPTGSVQRRRTTPPVFPSKSCFLGFLPTKFPEYPIDEEKGIDLVLRVAAGDAELLKEDYLRSAWSFLQQKRNLLLGKADSALLVREPGNGDEHSLLIVRSCLADVVSVSSATTESGQVDLIYEKVRDWAVTLFQDGSLDAALSRAGLDGGRPSSQTGEG